jgi:hypothetical protein
MRERRRFLARGLALILLGACAAPPAWGQVFRRDPAVEPANLDIDGREYKPYGQAKIGLFRFHPFASLSATYDHNLFLAPPYQRKDDFVFDTVGGLRTDWRLGRHETLLTYQAKYRAFLNHPAESLLEQRLSLLSQWNFNHWLYLDVGDEYSHRKDPMPDEIDLRTDRDTNDAFVKVGAFEEKVGAEVEVRFNWVDFVEPAFRTLDHYEPKITLSGYYLLREDSQLAQKVYAFLEFTYGSFRFPERHFSDSNWASVTVGAKGTLFDRFGFVLKVGYAGIDPCGNGTTGDTESSRGPMYEAMVMYNFDETLQFGLSSYRRIQYATDSNYRIFDRVQASVGKTFFDSLYVKASAFLDHADPSDSRNLTRMGCGLGVEYFLQGWLAASTGWEFSTRTARRIGGTPSADYREHQIYLMVTAFF